MKKMFSVLVALLVFLGACAFALNGANYPAWDGSSPPDNGMAGNVGGNAIALEFDPAGEYSNLADSLIQACFFAFDESQNNYLELYLKIPESVAPGDTLTSMDMANAASVTLYEVMRSSEDFYFASQVLGIPYPAGSSYEIRIDKAERTAKGLSISGQLNARLILMDDTQSSGETLELSDMRFAFTLPLGSASVSPEPKASAAPEASAAPAPTQQPESTQIPILPLPTQTPRPTMDPHPAFTLPPDYRVI